MNDGLTCVIDLPADFRWDDFLAFHRRDAQMFAERVTANALQKGLVWEGAPACLSLEFDGAQLKASLHAQAVADDALARLVRRMLGIDQPTAAFESACQSHPKLGPLLACRPGLRVPVTATPFEALSWAIIGQQISVRAAVGVRRNLIRAAGIVHASGLACYPDAAAVHALGEAGLRGSGLSMTKARCLLAIVDGVLDGLLPLDDWLDQSPIEDIRERLLAIKGIGPWTVNYALLRGFGWLDGSLHGDIVVRRSLQTLLGQPEKLSEEAARRWLSEFSPWRALVAAHLWASGGVVA